MRIKKISKLYIKNIIKMKDKTNKVVIDKTINFLYYLFFKLNNIKIINKDIKIMIEKSNFDELIVFINDAINNKNNIKELNSIYTFVFGTKKTREKNNIIKIISLFIKYIIITENNEKMKYFFEKDFNSKKYDDANKKITEVINLNILLINNFKILFPKNSSIIIKHVRLLTKDLY